jgi:hypothetical protein
MVKPLTFSLHREWHRPNFRDIFGWLSRHDADTADRCLESPPKTRLYGSLDVEIAEIRLEILR